MGEAKAAHLADGEANHEKRADDVCGDRAEGGTEHAPVEQENEDEVENDIEDADENVEYGGDDDIATAAEHAPAERAECADGQAECEDEEVDGGIGLDGCFASEPDG